MLVKSILKKDYIIWEGHKIIVLKPDVEIEVNKKSYEKLKFLKVIEDKTVEQVVETKRKPMSKNKNKYKGSEDKSDNGFLSGSI